MAYNQPFYDRLLTAEHEEAGTDQEEGESEKAVDINEEIKKIHEELQEHRRLLNEIHQHITKQEEKKLDSVDAEIDDKKDDEKEE